eukprot:TRINITY_DN1549_c0_g1_i1.p1 TRINITY_DN1549_c0_g1~~TRINITY_DN1549_c0_g1_i1.p1  ORF type:complete len:830 (+),score=102.71 TRINITY_DN1549_c0_g1_i1:42-2531(+)
MKVQLLLFSLYLLLSSVYGVDYYFSSSTGNDSSTRCTPITAPCKTIDRLNLLTWQTAFHPGDRVLFKNGDTFRGQVRDLSWWSGVTFGSYGEETSTEKPVISGTVLLDDWSKGSNGLYVTKLLPNFTDVQNLFIDSVKMPWSRTPNLDNPPTTRYFNITASGSNFLKTTSDKSPSGTWNGATLRARIYLWSVTTRTVLSHTFDGTTATFTLTEPFEQGYVPGVGWKFYVENKVAAIDRPGEWAFDHQTNQLSFLPPSAGFDPSKHQIEAAVYTNAFIFVISQNLAWINLKFVGQTSSAVLFQQSGSTSGGAYFENCDFIDQEQSGLEINAMSNLTVTRCTFTGMQNSALNVASKGLTISYNNITNVGMVQGHQNKGGGVGMNLGGSNAVVIYNNVVNMSYNGIVYSNTPNSKIAYNYVNGVTLTMSDGGALYTYGSQSTGSLVQNNIVTNSRSLPWDGFTNGDASLSHGIYIDNWCSGITVDSNTVVDVDGSCLFANSGGHTWTNNLLVGAGAEGTIVVEEMSGNTVVNNHYENNIVYVRHPEDVGMIKETSNVHHTTTQMASYKNNLYCNPYGSIFFTWNNGGYEGGKGFQSWMATGRDPGATVCSEKFGPFYDAGNVSSAVTLNSNPTFAKDVSGWVCSSCQMTWMQNSPVSNDGSMKVSVNSPSYTQIQTKGMTCVEGQYYRLRFKAYATQEVVFWTGVLENAPPYGIVPKENLVFVITNEVREYNVVFASNVNSPCMVMLGASYGPETVIYFDNFYMESVTMVENVVWDYVAVNPSQSTRNVPIPSNTVFTDINGKGPFKCSVSLGPYQSKLLIYSGPNTDKCED